MMADTAANPVFEDLIRTYFDFIMHVNNDFCDGTDVDYAQLEKMADKLFDLGCKNPEMLEYALTDLTFYSMIWAK
jgi:hypothetical protein